MSKKVFVSGSISIKSLPDCVKKSIDKIKDSNIEILIGDADGIDMMVQKYCKELQYFNVTVYSIYPKPRFMAKGFKSNHIVVTGDSKKEREKQKEKDTAMTEDCDSCLVVWDGKSKGSYSNILRAIDNNKKLKIYMSTDNCFLEPTKLNSEEIENIFRKNNGYSAGEVVECLKSKGVEYFQETRAFNKSLLDHEIIKKEGKIYVPMPKHENRIMIDKYQGKVKGIRFSIEFIDWVKERVEEWIIEENRQAQDNETDDTEQGGDSQMSFSYKDEDCPQHDVSCNS